MRAMEFQRVYDEFQPRVRRYLTRLVGAREADDLTQETFLRISQALGGFRGESALSTWVYRIATNVALDRLRSSSFQAAARQAAPQALTILGVAPAVEQEIAREEMGQCIRGFIAELPVDYRSVLGLSELAELPDRQIAEVLGPHAGDGQDPTAPGPAQGDPGARVRPLAGRAERADLRAEVRRRILLRLSFRPRKQEGGHRHDARQSLDRTGRHRGVRCRQLFRVSGAPPG